MQPNWLHRLQMEGEYQGIIHTPFTQSSGKMYIPGCVQVNLTRTWVTVSSLLLSFVFVFGNSIKSIYEAVVYLFVVRPFDVGDAVLLGPAQDWCNVRMLLKLLNPITADECSLCYTCAKCHASAVLDLQCRACLQSKQSYCLRPCSCSSNVRRLESLQPAAAQDPAVILPWFTLLCWRQDMQMMSCLSCHGPAYIGCRASHL